MAMKNRPINVPRVASTRDSKSKSTRQGHGMGRGRFVFPLSKRKRTLSRNAVANPGAVKDMNRIGVYPIATPAVQNRTPLIKLGPSARLTLSQIMIATLLTAP